MTDNAGGAIHGVHRRVSLSNIPTVSVSIGNSRFPCPGIISIILSFLKDGTTLKSRKLMRERAEGEDMDLDVRGGALFVLCKAQIH